jgi:cysteine synthase A
MLYNNVLETIGKTPMVRLNRIAPDSAATIYAKLESFNPLHSVKDRVAMAMIEDAERKGILVPGKKVIVEPTSGNTGIGLAMVCAVKGYDLILTMPDTFSLERRKLLAALGARLVLTPGADGMAGAVGKAKEMCESDPKNFTPLQFDNPANPLIHFETTAREILADIPDPDAFVSTVGTGGTVTGVGRHIKAKGLKTIIVAVEPSGSPVLSGGKRGPHRIQGIGAGFIPSILDLKIVDRIMQVEDEEAAEYTRSLAKKEGILAGISSGAALAAAVVVAKELGKGKKVVFIAPDTGERYLSTDLFGEI